jgi:hypothetical protein
MPVGVHTGALALALPAPTVIAAVTAAAASVANTGRRFLGVLALFVLVLITSLSSCWFLDKTRVSTGCALRRRSHVVRCIILFEIMQQYAYD